jgi:hypothetical protein
MNNTTESYIILKPISERFNRIAKEITDDEIKYLIKDTIKEQLIKTVSLWKAQDVIDEFIYDHEDEIKELTMASIKDKLKGVR